MSRQRATREQLYYHPPIFSFPEQKFRHADRNPHYSSRKHHLRRLNDIVHLCLQRGDIVRAKDAFSVLARCGQVEWTDMWRTAIAVLGGGSIIPGGQASTTSPSLSGQTRLELLKAVVAENKKARVEAMTELILTYIAMGQYQEARDYLCDEYLSIYPHHDDTILQTYGGLLSLQLSYEIGTTQNTFSQSLLQIDKNALVLNKNHLRAAKDHFEQALRLDAHNEMARSFIEKLRPQFNLHGIKVSMPDLVGQVEKIAKPDNDMARVRSSSGSSSSGIRDPVNVASEPEDEELEPSDDDGHKDDTSPTRGTFGETFGLLGSLRQNLHGKLLSEGLVQLSVADHDAITMGEMDHEVPEPSSSRNKQRPTCRTSPPHHDESCTSGHRQTATVMITPSLGENKRLSAPRSPRKDKPVSPNALSIAARRKSFADINQDASPELVDDTVYIEEESTDYGNSSPEVSRSRSPNSARQFKILSPTRSAMAVGPVSGEEASDSEMDFNAEWAQ